MAEINAVAIIGAGTAGRRIAESAVLAGFKTVLVDILPSSLRQAQSEMRDRLQQAQHLGRVSPAKVTAALERLRTAVTASEAAREADLVIEAVPDEMESKLEIFTLLDKIARPGTVLACTTASLSISEIASITYRQPSILGMRFHFQAESASIGSLQIVPTRDTAEQVIQACVAAGRRMFTQVEIVNERPG
jgi:3-hydroxybutyryl-CoA dehydrogenase